MRALFASFVSEHLLVTSTAYLSFVLTVLLVLWFKFAELVHAVWTSIKHAIIEVLDFRDELRRRKTQRTTAAQDSGAVGT
jgi:hypothetical protein